MDNPSRFWRVSKLLFRKKFSRFITSFTFFILFLGVAVPSDAHAFSIFGFIKNLFLGGEETTESNIIVSDPPPKPFPFLSAEAVQDPKTFDVPIVDEIALMSVVGPLGNVAEAAESAISYKISTYTVRKGDTLSAIAESFGVSVSTIRWANDIPRGAALKEGVQLVILPVSGVRHVVAKGDTIESIAKKYGGEADEILAFNDLAFGAPLAAGSVVVVPDGEVAESRPAPAGAASSQTLARGGGPEIAGYYLRPLVGGIRTRGIHGYNGVDVAAPRGTAVRASAVGTVIIARGSGWNGGYGKYIVIEHANGTQTLYAHLDSVAVVSGVGVGQGQTIGYVGNTGKSTGSHLHFEVRGAKNPF